jgi:hypothetical protein
VVNGFLCPVGYSWIQLNADEHRLKIAAAVMLWQNPQVLCVTNQGVQGMLRKFGLEMS